MSPREVQRERGKGWEVRWREGGRRRSRTFDRKGDAETFESEVRRRKQLGTLAYLLAGDERLADFGVEWWRRRVERLAKSTRVRYAQVWDLHVLAHLGEYQLRELTPEVIEEWVDDRLAAGVGAATVRKAIYMLQACLGYAVRRERIPENPCREVEKPRQRRRKPQPLPPVTVEAVRDRMRVRDATLVSVLAYGGLRPSEALALRWGSVRERTIVVEGGVVLGEEKDTKTHVDRSVNLLSPLAQDLAEWRMASGRPPASAPLFPRPDDGDLWQDHDYRNWRRRAYQAQAQKCGVSSPRPYDLRHSFVSLLIQEGRSIAYVAEQAGHSVEECARTYVHVIKELQAAPRIKAEDQIRHARDRQERLAI